MKSIFVNLFIIILLNTGCLSAVNAIQDNHFSSSVFPAYYYYEEELTSGTAENLTIVPPLMEYKNSSNDSLFALRPLLSYEKQPLSTEFDFVYPFFKYSQLRKTDKSLTASSWHLFPILYNKKKEFADGTMHKTTALFPVFFYGNFDKGKKYLWIFPFIFYAHQSPNYLPLFLPSEQNFRAFLPFYGNFEKFGGRNIQTILWPLYVATDKKGQKCTSIPWPFFGIFHGKASGFKLWPLVGFHKTQNESGSDDINAYYLWPFGHYIKQEKDIKYQRKQYVNMLFPLFINISRGNLSMKYFFPVYSEVKATNYRTVTYLFPLLLLSENTKEKFRQFRFLYILFNRKWGEKNNDLGILNIYGHKLTPNSEYRFFLWPFITYKVDETGNESRHRTYIFPLYSNQTTEYKDGSQSRRYFFLPFFGIQEGKSGDNFFRTLWPWWYSKDNSVERNWAPFWSFYETSEKANGDYCQSLFGKLYYSEKNGIHSRKEFNLLIYSYQNYDNVAKHKFFGLFSLEF